MPELPEVETIRLQLDKLLLNKTITAVSVLSPRNFIGDKKNLIGRKILSVKRRAKVILMELNNGDYLAVHLKMTGQLIYREKEKISLGKDNCGRYDVSVLPNNYTRVIISLNKGKLYFNDLRKFGWMKVLKISNFKFQISNSGQQKLDKIAGGSYGPEPFDKGFTEEYLQNIFAKTSRPIKLILLDQEKIAGIGNIYASEVLFKAGILPMKPAKKLGDKDIKILREAVIKILTKAIKQKGTSDKDEAYRQSNGEKGNYQNYLKVYGRNNEKCPKCHGIIKRIKIGGRGTFYCPQCQT